MKRVSLALSLGLLLACGSDSNGSVGDRTDEESSPSTAPRDGGVKPRPDAGKPPAGGGTTSTPRPKPLDEDGNILCSSKTIPARIEAPDILIVLDKSLSMLAGRWGPSVQAVNDFAAKYQGVVSFGLSTFPGNAADPCSAGLLDVPLALNNADPISSFLASTFPTGVTPTAPALRAALEFLGDRTVQADTIPPTAYVVLVTDGAPTCPWTDTPDPTQSTINATQALADANIKTYGIGYNLDPAGKMLLDQVATIGGSERSYPVENPDELNAAFDAITKDVVKCEFELDEEPMDPSYVLISIDGQPVHLDPADGWVIEGKHVTLVGGSCDMLKDGQMHALRASVECTQVFL
jgi:Mg-chelatase subunit ChlD